MALTYTNPIIDILTVEHTEPQWLIPDFLLQGSLVALAGEPGTGKSVLSYTLGLAIASGYETLSGIVPAGEPRRVLYFDQENGHQDRDKYLLQCWHGLKNPDVALLHEHFFPVHFALGQDEWPDVVAEYVDLLQPHVTIFDTTTPCFNIEEENSNGEATRATNRLRELARQTDPVMTILVIKHAKMLMKKGGRRTMRGGKAWEGAVDGTMYQVRAPGRPRNNGLSLTRLEPAKTRAYGLRRTIYITPEWTDTAMTGLVLSGSYMPNSAHSKAERDEDRELED